MTSDVAFAALSPGGVRGDRHRKASALIVRTVMAPA
jgi:hypothetical protein